jgi:DNA-binding transcriptional LysR family regulator
MIFELSDLRIFLAVAEEESISRAAERLNYVQSNVSARVRNLEERLGVTLLNRQSRGVTLSPAGRVFHAYAIRILALAGEAERMIQEKDAPAGTFMLGSLETTAAVRLPALLATYHRQWPQVELQLRTGTTDELLNNVLNYQVDAAFVGGGIEHPDLVATLAFREELVMAAAPETELTRTTPCNILVFRRGCSYRGRLEAWLREEGILPYRIMEFGSVDGIIGCVAAGMGITVLPRSVFGSARGVVLRPLPPHIAAIETMLVRRRDAAPSRAVTALLELIATTDHSPK